MLFRSKRGHLSLSNNNGPMDITTDNGYVRLKNVLLVGPNSSLRVASGDGFTSERLNMDVNAELDLRILQIFMPFLDDLGGPLLMSANITGRVGKPTILGTAKLNNAFVKLKGFPHPIERLSSDISFSQSRISINDIKGQIAGGTLEGEGSVQINGPQNWPVNIHARLNNVTMNVPDKVRTSGNAELQFAGNWFPFTLSGVYHVNGGIFEKEFIDDSGTSIGVRQSQYLPKVLRETQFEPILLDLQIILDKPLAVKNSLFDGTVDGQIQVKGAPTSPILIGKINAERRSRLIFKDKAFDVQTAVIDFNDPNEINPNLYVSATSRINEYDITLLAQGFAKNPTIKMTSVPPLSDQDIVSLIALGITTGTSGTDQTYQQQVAREQTGLTIGGAVLAAPVNRQLESHTGFNLSVTSGYDSTRNISIPKVTLSRKLTDRLKMSGSRNVGDVEGYDVKLEYFLNSNWTAVGSYENKTLYENTILLNSPQETENVFGLDLEFKREFK